MPWKATDTQDMDIPVSLFPHMAVFAERKQNDRRPWQCFALAMPAVVLCKPVSREPGQGCKLNVKVVGTL